MPVDCVRALANRLSSTESPAREDSRVSERPASEQITWLLITHQVHYNSFEEEYGIAKRTREQVWCSSILATQFMSREVECSERRVDHRDPETSEAGLSTAELCLQHGITEQAYHAGWRSTMNEERRRQRGIRVKRAPGQR
jgi:hypothetical protein